MLQVIILDSRYFSVKIIILEDFFKWLKAHETMAGEEIARRFEKPLKESIIQANWQIKKLNESTSKLNNIMNEPYGKALILYMRDTDEDFAKMYKKKIEEEFQ